MKQSVSRSSKFDGGSWLFLITVVLFAVLVFLHLNVTQNFTWPILFGYRSEAVFDLWSIQHFVSGVFVGSVLIHLKLFSPKQLLKFVSIVFLVALLWELFELFGEIGLFGQAVSDWKLGYEHWANRFVGDILLAVVGSLIAYNYNACWKIVLLPAVVWLVLNVTASDSMAIQRSLFGS